MHRIPSELDQKCIKQLIKAGLFTKILPEKLDASKGAVVALCADGDQFIDTHNHIAGLCSERLHTLSLNGGALLLSTSKMQEEQRVHGNVLFDNILTGSEIKEIRDIFLFTHFPCAIAGKHGLGAYDQGLCMMEAKERLKKANHNFNVKCFFQVFELVDGQPVRRTYFLPKEMWDNPEICLPVVTEFKKFCQAQ